MKVSEPAVSLSVKAAGAMLAVVGSELTLGRPHSPPPGCWAVCGEQTADSNPDELYKLIN